TGTVTITAADIDNGSADACGIQSLKAGHSRVATSDAGPNTVTLTVTDVNGNTSTGTAVVTVEDNTAPVVNTQNITVQLDATGTVTITAADIDNGSADACGIQSLSLDQTAFDCTNVGPNTVTLTVTDVNGNTATGTAVVTVEDRTAPVPEQNQLPVITATCSVDSLTAPVARDNCGTVITATSTAVLPITENTVISWVFTDASGNETVQNQEVRIVDPTAPVITGFPVGLEEILNGADPYILPDFTDTAKATDNCDLISFTQSPAAGTVYSQAGEVRVTLTARDRFGNETQVSFNITLSNRVIVDLENPQLITVPWNTPLGTISLPSTVQVGLSNGEKRELAVTWNTSSYNPLLAAVYQLDGTLELGDIENPEDLQPSLLILVEDKLAPTDILLSNTGFRADISTNEEIGLFTTVDDQDNIHNYELVSAFNNDGKYFRIEGNRLYLNTTDPLPGKTRFTIVVSSTDRVGNIIERTFVLNRTRIPLNEVVIFNSFTPDGDGKNDTWGVPELAYFRGGRVQVFERDGRRVFYTESPEESWDGTYEGKELPTGTYIWTLESRETGEVRRGVLTLMRY
ncbi:MAG: gliding motility-associated C-terminal domain-containing protein, partial [Cyclobacteriaceae bacterium]|nr:gliding motility-associated C-terminal domain-containing protein [Cyclobacteriaceae bacterium]